MLGLGANGFTGVRLCGVVQGQFQELKARHNETSRYDFGGDPGGYCCCGLRGRR